MHSPHISRDQLAGSRSRPNLIQDWSFISYSVLWYLFYSTSKGFPSYNLCHYLIKMVLAHSHPSNSWNTLRKGESWITLLKLMSVVDLLFCIWNLKFLYFWDIKEKKWPFSTLSLNSKCRQCNFWNAEPRVKWNTVPSKLWMCFYSYFK